MIQQLWHGSCCCWVMVTMGDGDEPCRNPKAVSSSGEIIVGLLFQVSHFHSATNLTISPLLWNNATFKKLSQNCILQEMTGDPLKFSYYMWKKKKSLLYFLFPGPIEDNSVGLACWGDTFWDQCRPLLSSSLSVPVRGSAVFVAVSGFRHLLASYSLVHPSTALHPTPPVPASQLLLSPCIAFCMDSCDLAFFCGQPLALWFMSTRECDP